MGQKTISTRLGAGTWSAEKPGSQEGRDKEGGRGDTKGRYKKGNNRDRGRRDRKGRNKTGKSKDRKSKNEDNRDDDEDDKDDKDDEDNEDDDEEEEDDILVLGSQVAGRRFHQTADCATSNGPRHTSSSHSQACTLR